MANNRPTLYVGVTSDLVKRVYQHQNNLVKGFTARYNVHKLVYYENFDTIEQAIIREKQLKDMNRIDKINLIKVTNPYLRDLYTTLFDSGQARMTTEESGDSYAN